MAMSDVITESEMEFISDNAFRIEKTSLVFTLVLKNPDLGGCRRVKAKINLSLPPYLKEIWKPTVFVINHQTAIKQNLAIS